MRRLQLLALLARCSMGLGPFAQSAAFLEQRRLNALSREAAAEAFAQFLNGTAREHVPTPSMRDWIQELAEVHNMSEPEDISDFEGVEVPIYSHHLKQMHALPARGSVHVFAIGDWGAILPSHLTAPNRKGGKGYVHSIDDRAQILVANQVKARAAASDPQYVLNTGDNFYWAGLPFKCGAGSPGTTMAAFAAGWQSMYGSVASKPWLSVLGNHDYGGYVFTAGWEWQIKYSFSNPNWVLPARYYSRTMVHQGFSVDYFMLDTNNFDAHEPGFDPEHNICSAAHNHAGASCASVGGPASVGSCMTWFWDSYRAQKTWLEQKLAASTADWQVVVTHFPCGTEPDWFSKLHQTLGLDLLVTGHRHDQELWAKSSALGGLTCIVAGGGGGVTSEGSPSGTGASGQYGFFDLTLSKDMILVESINLNGEVIQKAVVTPS